MRIRITKGEHTEVYQTATFETQPAMREALEHAYMAGLLDDGAPGVAFVVEPEPETDQGPIGALIMSLLFRHKWIACVRRPLALVRYNAGEHQAAIGAFPGFHTVGMDLIPAEYLTDPTYSGPREVLYRPIEMEVATLRGVLHNPDDARQVIANWIERGAEERAQERELEAMERELEAPDGNALEGAVPDPDDDVVGSCDFDECRACPGGPCETCDVHIAALEREGRGA